MCRKIYELLITTKLRGINLFEYLDIAKKHGMVILDNDVSNLMGVNPETNLKATISAVEDPVFIRVEDVDKEIETHVAIFENLLFKFSYDWRQNDRIIRIFLKRPEDEWEFEPKRNKYDILNPINVCAEVYTTYDVSVLKLDRCYGEEYKTGVWNKMFYKSLCKFLSGTQGYTEISKIKKAYEK